MKHPITHHRTALLLVALAVAAPGCGGNGGAGDVNRLSTRDAATARAALGAVHDYCHKAALYLAGKGAEPVPADEQRAADAIDRLVSIARAKPEAPLTEAVTMRDALADTAEDLEGSNCGPSLLERLNEGLASLPPQR